MIFQANDIKLSLYEDVLIIPCKRISGARIVELCNKAKKGMSVEIKQYREKRSLDSNAYLWVLCQKIAEVMGSSKDEIYDQMIIRYGRFKYGVFKPDDVQTIQDNYRASEIVGPAKVNGQDGIQLRLYVGSSHYNTKEMSILLNGIISECKELDIETLTPNEIERLNIEWGK